MSIRIGWMASDMSVFVLLAQLLQCSVGMYIGMWGQRSSEYIVAPVVAQN